MDITFTAASGYVRIYTRTETLEQAQELASIFPKFVKAKGEELGGSATHKGYFSVVANINSTGVTGDYNETGVKRINTTIRKLREAGHTVNYTTEYRNSYPESQIADIFAY